LRRRTQSDERPTQLNDADRIFGLLILVAFVLGGMFGHRTWRNVPTTGRQMAEDEHEKYPLDPISKELARRVGRKMADLDEYEKYLLDPTRPPKV